MERFPENFRFQLSEQEWGSLKSQIVTSKTGRGGRRYLPYVFSEQGVAMLSAVLNSSFAIATSIRIMSAFAELRKVLVHNQLLFARLDRLEFRQSESDQKFEAIFKALESKASIPEKGIFFEGQIFEAYHLVSEIFRGANKDIILIDNFVDDQILSLLSKRKMGVSATIYTRQISKTFQLDLNKYNGQYPEISVRVMEVSHDRFLVIDQKILYHFGASLKDLGKKWFAFSRMDDFCQHILKQLTGYKVIDN